MSTLTIKQYSLIGSPQIHIHPYERIERIKIDYKSTPDFSYVFIYLDAFKDSFAVKNEHIDVLIEQLSEFDKNTSVKIDVPLLTVEEEIKSRMQAEDFNKKIEERINFIRLSDTPKKSEEEVAKEHGFLDELKKMLNA